MSVSLHVSQCICKPSARNYKFQEECLKQLEVPLGNHQKFKQKSLSLHDYMVTKSKMFEKIIEKSNKKLNRSKTK